LAQPLGLVRGRLVSQIDREDAGNTLTIGVLDAATGAMAGNPASRELPAGVRAAIDETFDGRFVAMASPGDNDTAIVSWDFKPGRGRGVEPGTADALSDPLPSSGRGGAAARGAQATGRGTAPLAQDAVRSSALAAGAFRLNLATREMSPADARTAAPFGVFAALEAPSQVSPPVERLPRLPPSATQLLSADRRYALASEAIADDSAWDKYQLTIHDRGTGNVLGKLASHVPTVPFYVSTASSGPPILVYATPPFTRQEEGRLVREPLRVRALNLANGVEVWSRDVRDPSLRRAPPP